MKISLSWLNDFIDLKDYQARADELAKMLTAAGIEVESVADNTKAFAHIKIGRLLEVGQHPNADRLTVCRVDVGEGSPRQIVCGAKNHRVGDLVVAALPGAVLPGNFAIKESKIRDVESRGMLCSESELGMKAESEGILILPKDAPVGKDFADYMGLTDIVFELNVTPNRADCLSHLGLARELGCVLDREVKSLKPKFKLGNFTTKKEIKLKLVDKDLCPRYAGRLVRGVKVGPSPQWLKSRLEAVQINSINNVVDVTNYVMLELGQPMHAFDVRSLRDHQVTIARASEGEKFVTLDGTELKLKENDLTIRDGQGPVALAGVVGGKNSGVRDDTVDLFLESAHFSADSVRRTARRLGVQTDSAYRFSRGTDPSVVDLALERACELIQEIAGGEVAKDFYDEYPKQIKAANISIDVEYVEERLGYPVKGKDFTAWMKRLGCEVKAKGTKGYVVTPPVYRWDLGHKTDLVEEFGRLEGYDKIPEAFPAVVQKPLLHDAQYTQETRVVNVLESLGIQQAVNYGFTHSRWQKQVVDDAEVFKGLGLDNLGQAVALKNPLNEELDVMRLSLLPGLVKNLIDNSRYGHDLGRLFELGFVFTRKAQIENETDNKFMQQSRLSFAFWGQKTSLWQKDEARPVVYDLKTAIEGMLQKLVVTSFQWQTPQKVPRLFHPTQTVALFCEGRAIGVVGTLHPSFAQENKLRPNVALAEIDFAKLMRGQPRVPKASTIGRFPTVQRDLALVLPQTLPVADVIKEMRKIGAPLLQEVEVFDVFTGGNLAAEQKSVAFRMFLKDATQTLTEAQVSDLHQKMISGLQQKLKIQIRS